MSKENHRWPRVHQDVIIIFLSHLGCHLTAGCSMCFSDGRTEEDGPYASLRSTWVGALLLGYHVELHHGMTQAVK